ncbi:MULTISPECIES: FRG domain-containing protein [unclassified Mesorhizobium]|uniref:FRG domain-containing protein n=1 Tax=unclassified Mesorhizobium TaxID=325217 RepID=UPI000FD3C1E5|nr:MULTISPECIES: FRG domain-containing protein [unclassified Mesorhizobium]RVB77204.1 FRG domain-containing protein [Mesorhizobium sp. M6A.T.Cr.TU.014.01.1.1]RWQ05254.1 MAG: FRG domain-containing protein [Mesorhizobium sp.]RWQ10288.1 MAG: FRG domain-containing protein [Mesorhizobium sp.]
MTGSGKRSNYLEELPDWPDFSLPNDDIDGLLPACKVRDWHQFVEVMQDPEHNRTNREVIYRGQRGHNWQLSSTLSRQFDGGSIADIMRESLLLEFKLAMRGRGADVKDMDEAEVWAYGQHHGLFTPLLDWTRSPFVALFFAYESVDLEGAENPSRAVFCLNMSAIKALASDLFIEPRFYHNARLVNQAGLFTITPPGNENFVSNIFNLLIDQNVIQADDIETIGDDEVNDAELARDLAKYICKIHVPNVDRVGCLNMLRKMNIHQASLFPDPGGASQYSNDWLRRSIAEHKREDEERQKAKEEAARARRETTIVADAALVSDDTAAIADLLIVTFEDVSMGPEQIADWSEKIGERYQQVAAVDWPKRPNATAKLKIELQRLLHALEVPRELVETVVTDLIELLSRRYEASVASSATSSEAAEAAQT